MGKMVFGMVKWKTIFLYSFLALRKIKEDTPPDAGSINVFKKFFCCPFMGNITNFLSPYPELKSNIYKWKLWN